MRASLLALVGFGLAAIGNIGWALVIGEFGVSWPFWAFTLACVVAAIGSAVADGRASRILTATGWSVGAIGALRLLLDELGRRPGADFPAPELYYAGFLVAALGTFGLWFRREAPMRWLIIAGAALAAMAGVWWTVLDLAHGSLDYTWANASLGAGFLLVALGLASRMRAVIGI
jgi:hypothetical protein